MAAVLDLQHGQLHLGHGGPSNQDAVGVRAAGEALFGAADEALAGAGIADEQLDAAVTLDAVRRPLRPSSSPALKPHPRPAWLRGRGGTR
jgi:N-acetylglucosamine kinase-like BadF-type ATPase